MKDVDFSGMTMYALSGVIYTNPRSTRTYIYFASVQRKFIAWHHIIDIPRKTWGVQFYLSNVSQPFFFAAKDAPLGSSRRGAKRRAFRARSAALHAFFPPFPPFLSSLSSPSSSSLLATRRGGQSVILLRDMAISPYKVTVTQSLAIIYSVFHSIVKLTKTLYCQSAVPWDWTPWQPFADFHS